MVFKCKTCERTFATKQSLNRHIEKKSCRFICDICNKKLKSKKALNYHKNEKVCKNKINKNNNKSNNKTSNIKNTGSNNKINNYVNSNNNIIIIDFGKENIKKLSQNDLEQIFDKKNNIIENMIKVIHCNKNHPEYHNCLYNDYKSGYGKIYHDNEWELKTINDICCNIIDLRTNDCHKIINIFKDQLSENQIEKLKNKHMTLILVIELIENHLRNI